MDEDNNDNFYAYTKCSYCGECPVELPDINRGCGLLGDIEPKIGECDGCGGDIFPVTTNGEDYVFLEYLDTFVNYGPDAIPIFLTTFTKLGDD